MRGRSTLTAKSAEDAKEEREGRGRLSRRSGFFAGPVENVVDEEVEAKDAAERADVAHRAEDHGERRGARFLDAEKNQAAGDGEERLENEAGVVDGDRVVETLKTPAERDAAEDRSDGGGERGDGEIEADGEALGFEREEAKEDGELSEHETGAGDGAHGGHAAECPDEIDDGVVFRGEETPEEVDGLPDEQGEHHDGAVAEAVEEAAPAGEGERAAECGDGGENADVPRGEIELLEHEHVIERAEAVGGEGPDGAEGDEPEEGARAFHDADLLGERQCGGNGGAMRPRGADPLRVDRKRAEENGADDDGLEGADGVVPARENPAGAEEEGEKGDLKDAIASAEVFAAETGGNPLLDPGVPGHAGESTEDAGDKKPEGERAGGEFGVVAREELEDRGECEPAEGVEGGVEDGERFRRAKTREERDEEDLREVREEGHRGEQADGGFREFPAFRDERGDEDIHRERHRDDRHRDESIADAEIEAALEVGLALADGLGAGRERRCVFVHRTAHPDDDREGGQRSRRRESIRVLNTGRFGASSGAPARRSCAKRTPCNGGDFREHGGHGYFNGCRSAERRGTRRAGDWAGEVSIDENGGGRAVADREASRAAVGGWAGGGADDHGDRGLRRGA
jgi:hypothetical protein